MTSPQRVLVTGGAGFIGSHLVERLLNDGHHVTVLDNLSSGRRSNLQNVEQNPRLDFHCVDVGNLEESRPFYDGVRYVFHLAALADVVPSIDNPRRYHAANVEGTIGVLEACRDAGVEKIVYTASSSCYGIPDTFPTPESAPMRPMFPYALTKYVGEQYVMHWAQLYKMRCASLRLFNVYGPRSRSSGTYGAVFGVFLAQKLAEKPLTVVGNGEQTRDFVFVTDVADAFVRAAASDVDGEIMNVGSGNPHSINQLVKLLGGDVVHIPKRPGEPDSTFADTEKIRRILKWEPKVRFEDGVRVMLDSIHLWQDAPVWDVNSISDATRDWFKYLGDSPRTQHQPGQPTA